MSVKKIDWRTATDAEKCAAVHSCAPELPMPVDGIGDPNDRHPDFLHDPRAWWPLVEEMHSSELRRYPAGDGKPGFAWSVWTGFIPKEPDSVSRSPGEAVCIAYLRSQGWEVSIP